LRLSYSHPTNKKKEGQHKTQAGALKEAYGEEEKSAWNEALEDHQRAGKKEGQRRMS